MFINELEVGTELIVEVSDSKSNFNFTTNVIEITNEQDKAYLDMLIEKLKHAPCVFVEKITYEDKIVNFDGAGFGCKATTTFEDRPYVWQSVKIPKISLPSGDSIHLLIAIDNVEPLNQRAEYRCFLGIDGFMRIGESKAIKNVLVRDVSISGIGVIADIGVNINPGDTVNISWYDGQYSTIKKEIVDTLYKIDAHVVRVVKMNNNRCIIGCVTDKKTSVVERYIATKQRERLKAQRQQPKI